MAKIQKLCAEVISGETRAARNKLLEIRSMVEAFSANNKRPGLTKKFNRADELLRQIVVSLDGVKIK